MVNDWTLDNCYLPAASDRTGFRLIANSLELSADCRDHDTLPCHAGSVPPFRRMYNGEPAYIYRDGRLPVGNLVVDTYEERMKRRGDIAVEFAVILFVFGLLVLLVRVYTQFILMME